MRIILLGPPGAGKGTQGELLAKHWKIPRIATGDMLRQAINNQDPIGLEAQALVEQGILVPDEIIIRLIEKRLKQPDCSNGYLFDGVPRTIAQAKMLADLEINFDYILELQVPETEIIKRLSGRRVHEQSGRVYHIESQPPKQAGIDDITGESLIQRQDDTKKVIKHRLKVYKKQTAPLIDYYKNLNHGPGICVINSIGTVESIYKNILNRCKLN